MSSQALQNELFRAARDGDCSAIRLCVLHGADIEGRDSQGRTALHIASQNGRTDAMKTLTAAKHMLFCAKEPGSAEDLFFKKARILKKTGNA